MKKLYTNVGFMLLFMILLVFFNMLFGSKTTEMFLWLILLGMVITNVDSVTGLFKA